MIGILDEHGAIVQVVYSLDGVDTPFGSVPDVPDGFLSGDLVWDGSAFVENLAKIETECLEEIDQFVAQLVGEMANSNQVLDQFRAEKRKELERWNADGPDRVVTAENYPFIVAEAQARGVPPETVVQEIAQQVALWLTMGAAIEAHRVSGRAAVRSAQTAAAKKAAKNATIATILSLVQ